MTSNEQPTKWNAISDILTSTNGLIFGILFVLLVIVLIIAVKKGYLKFSGKGINIGNDSEKERNVIRQQVEWVHIFLDSFAQDYMEMDGVDEWRLKYIVEKVFSEIVDWITFNHITDRGNYIKIKQDKIWYLIKSLTSNKYFKSGEFRNKSNAMVETVVSQLVKIREFYD